jgi:hypothetical protein
MPRVPTAEGFGVLPGIRSGGARPVLSVEQAAQPGRQMEARGEQMVQIGGLVGDYAQQQQERVNRLRVQDAYVQAQNFGREIELEQRKLTGQSAVGSTEAFGERYNKRMSELAQDLSPIAQEAFRAKTDALYGGFLDRGTKYEADQLEVYDTSVTNATLMTAMQNMQAFINDPVEFERNRNDAKDTTRMIAIKKGLSGAEADQEVQAQMGKIHSAIIKNMLDGGDPRGANAYFAQVSEDFLPLDAKSIRNEIDGGLAPAEASDLVDTLLAEMPLPKGLNIPASDMDNWLRGKTSDPVVLKAAQEDLRGRVTAHKEQYNNGQADAYQKSVNIGETQGINMMRRTAAFQSLTPQDQLAIQDYFTNRQAVAEGRQAAAESRETAKRNEARDAAFYDIVYTEGGLKMLEIMSPASVRVLRGTVGDRNFGALVETYESLKEGPDRVYAVSLDNTTFNNAAFKYNYDPLSTDPEEKRAIVELRATVQTAIAAKQNSIGRPLDLEEKQKVIDNVFATGVATARVPVISGFWGDQVSMVPTDQLTPEQAANIKIESIPYAERLRIVKELGDDYNRTRDPRSDPENPNNVRAMYLAERGFGVAND